MKTYQKILLFSLLCILPLMNVRAEEQDLASLYPRVVISNGVIETAVFVPDMLKGFYRSSRYEHSGMVAQLTYRGHTFFRQRVHQIPHDPENPGHGISLAEEFAIGTSRCIPQRFEEAQAGETFLKIGVGTLEKPGDGKKYSFGTTYTIIDPGVWTVAHGKNWIEFTHELNDEYGLGYFYTKRMELTEGKPELVISHTIKNTGTQKLVADQYNHNFFAMDYEPIGPGYEIELFFPARCRNNLAPNAALENRTIKILKPLEGGIFTVMENFGESPEDGHCIIRNTKTGTGVDITGDFSLSGFNFYADTSSICPEFFTFFSLEPIETHRWMRTYRFFAE